MNRKQIEFVQAVEGLKQLKLSAMMPDLNNGECHLLGILGCIKCECQEQNIRVSDLVRMAPVPAPAVSRTLRTLEEKKLILRETDPDDRRNTLVKLTDAGIDKISEHDRILDGYFQKVQEAFTPERFQQLLDDLRDLTAIARDELKRNTPDGREAADL